MEASDLMTKDEEKERASRSAVIHNTAGKKIPRKHTRRAPASDIPLRTITAPHKTPKTPRNTQAYPKAPLLDPKNSTTKKVPRNRTKQERHHSPAAGPPTMSEYARGKGATYWEFYNRVLRRSPQC
jgi:hypothetical protein